MLALLALLFVVLPWFTGRYRSQRDQLASAGWERAERIEREQRMVVDEARLRERSRIAEDMHDSVGHELSLIAIRAAALEVDPELSERHRARRGSCGPPRGWPPSGWARSSAYCAGPGPTAWRPRCTPATESVADLVERAAASGLDVRLVQHGPDGRGRPAGGPGHPPGGAGGAHERGQVRARRCGRGPAGAPRRRGAGAGPQRPAGPAGRYAGLGRARPGRTGRAGPAGGRPADLRRHADGGFEVVATMPREGGARLSSPCRTDSSAQELALVRRTARRGLVTGVLATIGVAAGLGGLALGYYLVASYNSVLRPADYDALRLGQSPVRDRGAAAGDADGRRAGGEAGPGSGRRAVRVLPVGRAVLDHACLSAVLPRRPAGREEHHPDRLRPAVHDSERGNTVTIRVLLADDEAMVRAGVRAILASDNEIDVVAEAGDGAEAVELVHRHRPDVAVLDIRMPRMDGLAAGAEIRRTAPDTAVVMLTTFSEDAYIARALGDGASGFLLKSGDPRELIAGLKAVADGAAYLSPTVAQKVIAELGAGSGGRLARAAQAREQTEGLTPREREVLSLVGAGLSNAEIAGKLYLVEGTVKAYVSTVLTRLGVKNRVQAAIIAYEAGLV